MKNVNIIKLITFLLIFASQISNAQTISQCWKYIDVDTSGSLAISTNGLLYCWGANHVGQLGNGTIVDENIPVQITPFTWKMAVKYGGHCLAIKSDGTLWGWGNNYNGTLGSNPSSTAPIQIGTDNDWKKIATGMSHCLAIKTNGTLWSWGLGASGQLGQGTTGMTSAILPTQIGVDNSWISISCGDVHSMALNLYSEVYTFGENSDGQIGDGTTTDMNTPFLVNSGASAPQIVKIAAGIRTSFGIANTGELYACGDNFSGQLGDGTTTDQLSSVQIGTDSWLDIASGVGTTLGIKADGSLWAWGWNNNSFGVASPASSLTPIQIGIETNWKSLAVGLHSLAMKTNNELYSCGNYNYGALGLGSSTAPVNTFTQIGTTANCSASTDCNVMSDDFSDGSLWVHPYLGSAIQCNITYHTLDITGNEFKFLQSRDNAFNYMYRGVSPISDVHFKADIDFTHQSTIPGWGAGHTLLAINSTNKPFFNDPSTSTGGTPCGATPIGVSNSILDGIALIYSSALVSGATPYEFIVYTKDAGVLTPACSLSVTGGSTYYPRIERTSATTGTLSLYTTAARTTLLLPSVNFTLPATITNLNTLLIGTNEWQENDRMLTGSLDNICISNISDSCLSAKYYFDFGDTRDDLGRNDGINNGATLTTDRFGIPNAAYHFDGSLNQYIKVPNHFTNNFANDFSVAYWVLIDSSNGTDASIIAKHEPGTWNGYTFGANNTNPGYCNGAGTYTFYTASGAMQDVCANSLIANTHNTWMHVVGTFNHATNQSKLYIDDILQTDIGGSGLPIPNMADLIFGGIEYPVGSGTYVTNFHGKLDDISLYQCMLDSTEVHHLYTEKLGTVSTSEISKQDKLIIAPNPTTDKVFIAGSSKINKIEIINIQGVVLESQAVNSNEINISLSKYPAGLYFIKTYQANKIQSTKIVKE